VKVVLKYEPASIWIIIYTLSDKFTQQSSLANWMGMLLKKMNLHSLALAPYSELRNKQ
jgi:hypothetical protein